KLYSLGEAYADVRILDIECPAFGERHILERYAKFLSHRDGQQLACALCSLQGGIAGHQRDTARVAAQVDRRQVGIGCQYAYVKRIDAENLGDNVSQDRIRALAYIHRSAHDTNAALAVEAELHARVRHTIPVNRQSGPTNVRAARDPYSAAVGQLAV